MTWSVPLGDKKNMDSNDAFHEQLRLQELYGNREAGHDAHTFTDPSDGTEYEWDHDKKAWFPKVRSLCGRSALFISPCEDPARTIVMELTCFSMFWLEFNPFPPSPTVPLIGTGKSV